MNEKVAISLTFELDIMESLPKIDPKTRFDILNLS